MASSATRGAEEPSTADVDAIAFAYTAGSLLHGTDRERNLRQNLQEAAGGIPCVTTSQRVIDAFKHLGLHRVVVATPYIEDLNRAEKDFFEA